MPLNRKTIVEETETGPAAEFDRIYGRHKDDVFRFVYHLAGDRAEAEDLFQEVWLRAARHFGESPEPSGARPWLFRIAVNLHRDALRRKRVRRLFFLFKAREDASWPSSRGVSAERDDPAVRAEQATLQGRIELAVSALPEKQRRVFVLQEIEGLKQAEVAGIVGIPVGTVKSLMHRAVLRLQRELVDCHPKLEKIKCDVKMLSV
jgi:RNA polymerase sigma-70 factor (ECF subfamily)